MSSMNLKKQVAGAQHIAFITVVFSRRRISKRQPRTFPEDCGRWKCQPTLAEQHKGWTHTCTRRKDSSWILMSALYEWDRGNPKKPQPSPRGNLYPKLKFFQLSSLQAVLFCPAVLYHRTSLISETLNTKKPYTPT